MLQGLEKPVIILSTAVTRPGSFVGDAQRLNVALTRARHHLILVSTGSQEHACCGQFSDSLDSNEIRQQYRVLPAGCPCARPAGELCSICKPLQAGQVHSRSLSSGWSNVDSDEDLATIWSSMTECCLHGLKTSERHVHEQSCRHDLVCRCVIS